MKVPHCHGVVGWTAELVSGVGCGLVGLFCYFLLVAWSELGYAAPTVTLVVCAIVVALTAALTAALVRRFPLLALVACDAMLLPFSLGFAGIAAALFGAAGLLGALATRLLKTDLTN